MSCTRDSLKAEEVLACLAGLRDEIRRADSDATAAHREIHSEWRESARNLLHYLVLRRHDLREVQERLAGLGLSSLGRSESHVLANLERVMENLHFRLRRPWPDGAGDAPCDRERGRQWLDRHAGDLLVPPRPDRRARIMVTLPTEAGDDPGVAAGLIAAGMDVARINCARDDRGVWAGMVEHVRRAGRESGRPCRILMDLAGPKLRTGTIAAGPRVVKIRPARDDSGRVLAPARVWLAAGPEAAPSPEPVGAELTLDRTFVAGLQPGERITFTDAPGEPHTLLVTARGPGGCLADLERTAYVSEATQFRAAGGSGPASPVFGVPAMEQRIDLRRGETLILTADDEPGRPAVRDSGGRPVEPARIACTLPAVFAGVRAGEPIWFDDGRLGGIVRSVSRDALHIEITQARDKGERLGADKGINLPGSRRGFGALTAKDHADLPFVAAHADMVGLSFVEDPADIRELGSALAGLDRRDPGIVLKIETRRAFENLPELLLAAMRHPCSGVMIARGDLAVECGFERLAEIQEEILWICEAAHVPVIWATQVLESLAKDGRPSRAEITDAAMGHRAECVMLNKGPHIVAAVRALDDILRRMEAHGYKKSARLRELRIAREFFRSSGPEARIGAAPRPVRSRSPLPTPSS